MSNCFAITERGCRDANTVLFMLWGVPTDQDLD